MQIVLGVLVNVMFALTRTQPTIIYLFDLKKPTNAIVLDMSPTNFIFG